MITLPFTLITHDFHDVFRSCKLIPVSWFHFLMLYVCPHHHILCMTPRVACRLCLAPSCVSSMADRTHIASPPSGQLRTIIEQQTESLRFLFTSFISFVPTATRQMTDSTLHGSPIITVIYCMYFFCYEVMPFLKSA